MKLTFPDIINKHKNNPCLVMGHGPSLNPAIPELINLRLNGFLTIGCNEWYYFYEHCPPNYWVVCNSVNRIPKDIDKINQYKIPYLYADSVDLTNRNIVNKNIEGEWLNYDQRHFNGKKCDDCHRYSCELHLDPNRLTIQEELQKYTNYKEHYSSGDSIILHQLAFSILMGCNPIYIIGVDLDYRLGYANTNINFDKPPINMLNDYVPNIINDLKIINESAKNIGVKITNINKNSKFDVFPIGGIKL